MENTAYRCVYGYEKGEGADTDVLSWEPEEAPPQESLSSVLKSVARPAVRGNSISRLASSLHYVDAAASIESVVEALSPYEDLFSVGVVDEGEAVGLIVRRELFDLLGRNYGRDRIASGTARSIAKFTKSFPPDANVLSVADALEEDMRAVLIRYFLLKDGEGRFCGVFSTKDMLIHLSGTLRSEVAAVRSFQSMVVPDRSVLRLPGVLALAASRPAKDAGGDYYTCRRLPDGSLFAMVADVSGKGVSASYFTAACAAVTDGFEFKAGLGAYLMALNGHFARAYGSTGRFLTCVALILDPATGLVRACDMGHSHLRLLRGDAQSEVNLPACPPLGLDEALIPRVARFSLSKGDLLAVFTDGVLEQRDGDGREYGMDRALALLRGLESKDALERAPDALLADLDRFRGFSPQHDDATMALIRYRC